MSDLKRKATKKKDAQTYMSTKQKAESHYAGLPMISGEDLDRLNEREKE